MMLDCPLNSFDNGLFTENHNKMEFGAEDKIGAIQKLRPFRNHQDPPTVVYKHNMDTKIFQRPIISFGEDFDIELNIENCPKGYYCPNVMPIPVSAQNIITSITNYYDPTKTNKGVMAIKCANFPYRANADASAEDSWYLPPLHSTDF